ncbi:MAG: protein meaA [Acidimicrobiia bacterium]
MWTHSQPAAPSVEGRRVFQSKVQLCVDGLRLRLVDPSRPSEQGEREGMAEKDRPWIMRTYSGHTSAEASNALYRTNLAKGQTGLSVAFDLPTQLGYDPDDPMAQGEVGKVGVPITSIADMERLFEGIPLEKMNTSMTINATAPWLLALYVAVAERQRAPVDQLRGTTQNDIVKEYLSRGTYIFPPRPSMRLTVDVIAFTAKHMPKWNPVNVCSYHLQEAGATPVQELAYALTTAIAILDACRQSGQISEDEFPFVVGRISFFVNAGIRFIEEMCKLRAFALLWDEITRERYGVNDERFRRFRYGVQVNSLGLTEVQPENNIIRIAYEALGVTLSKRARASAIQLPAWNEALGLPRPWDQQWSLRIQQILAYETDLLEYPDIFDGSPVIEKKVSDMAEEARAEIQKVLEMGGALEAVESGYIKSQLVASNAERLRRIESGEQIVVGLNAFTEAEPSPLVAQDGHAILRVSPEAESAQIEKVREWRSRRDNEAVKKAIAELQDAAKSGENIMPVSIRAAHAGVTTGEWGAALREVFGEYRPPTGISSVVAPAVAESLGEVRKKVQAVSKRLGHPIRMLIGKPGLDGHSNAAEQLALRARDAGVEVIYEGIRLLPEQIARAAVEEGVDLVGVSILSGSHMELVQRLLEKMREEGATEVPLVVGGIIPPEDAVKLEELGVAKVYTPQDYDPTQVVSELVDIVADSSSKRVS